MGQKPLETFDPAEAAQAIEYLNAGENPRLYRAAKSLFKAYRKQLLAGARMAAAERALIDSLYATEPPRGGPHGTQESKPAT